MTGQGTGELRGLLEEGVLSELLLQVLLEKRSGSLHLACGSERSDLEFSAGYLVHAVTTLPGVRLGDLLVQVGLLSARDRDACLEIAALSKERMGETLLRHGLLDAESLAQGLALQLREVLARTLGWEGGVYTFTDLLPAKAVAPGSFEAPRLDPREILLDATWTLVGDPVIDRLLGDLTRRVRKARDGRLAYLDFRLTPADAFLLSRVDGMPTAEQLLDQAPVSRDEAKASLAGLLAVGAVEYVDAAPARSRTTQIASAAAARLAARINSPDPFEILGVSPQVSAEELRSAYLKLLRSCDPAATSDLELRPIMARMCEQLGAAFKEIERRRGAPRPEALKKTISRRPATIAPPKPGPPAPSASAPAKPAPSPAPAPAGPIVDPLLANDAAAQAFEQGRVHEALAILHEAIPRLEGRGRRAARAKKAKILLSVENGAKLAEEELRLAISEDSVNADAHVLLGGIYRDRGSVALAMMEYRKALELEPKNTTAREALDELRAHSDHAPDGSVLKRLFRG